MICKVFFCPQCRKQLLGGIGRHFFCCAACGHAFTPAQYRLVVRKGDQVARIRLVTSRSTN